MIEISPTKGYGYVKIEIYHNNKNIDFESIREEFDDNINNMINEEDNIIKSLK